MSMPLTVMFLTAYCCLVPYPTLCEHIVDVDAVCAEVFKDIRGALSQLQRDRNWSELGKSPDDDAEAMRKKQHHRRSEAQEDDALFLLLVAERFKTSYWASARWPRKRKRWLFIARLRGGQGWED